MVHEKIIAKMKIFMRPLYEQLQARIPFEMSEQPQPSCLPAFGSFNSFMMS